MLKAIGALIALAGLTAGLTGGIDGWYRHIDGFDKVVHVVTSFGLTLAIGAHAHQAPFRNVTGHLLWRVALLASAGLALGALWEIGEWFYDVVLQGQTVKSIHDTALDLLVDALGSLTAAIVVALLARRPVAAPVRRLPLEADPADPSS